MGLKIFMMLTVSAERVLHDFLLSDQQINESGAWDVMGKTQKIYKS
jgi:hypothetical protein